MKINTKDIRRTLDMIESYDLPEITEGLLNQMLRQVNELKSALSVSVPLEITPAETWGAIEPIIEYVAIHHRGGFLDYGRVVNVDKNQVTFEATVRKESVVDCIFTISEKCLNYWIDGTINEVYEPELTNKERSELFNEIDKYLDIEFQGGFTIHLLIDAIVDHKIPSIKWVKQW